MDLFRFTSGINSPMTSGQLITTPASITWVERYLEPGEVRIEAPLDSDIRREVPINSVVSHIDTREIVRIEDHEISDDGDGTPMVVITGRTIDAPIFENRSAGSNINFPTNDAPADYALPKWGTSHQALRLMQSHVYASYLIDDRDAVPYLEIANEVPSTGLTTEERKIKPGNVYDRVVEILRVDNLGLRTERPATGKTNSRIVIHRGKDRTSSVVLSVDKDQVENVGYLMSNRRNKNCVHVVGRWCQTRLANSFYSAYDRRWLTVDATDIDEAFESKPTGAYRTWVLGAMYQRGVEALAEYNMVEITKAEASRDSMDSIYRKHYNVGDIVTVAGGYGSKTRMRVTEYVEIQDETGFTGYPTLELVEGEDNV